MDSAEVLRQVGVSVSREFDFGPEFPFSVGPFYRGDCGV